MADDKSTCCFERCHCKSHKIICPHKSTLFITFCIMVNFCMQGFITPLLGTTIVHLELLFDVDTASTSFAFIANSIGVLIGSVICGLAYERIVEYREFSFSFNSFLTGVCIVTTPYIGDVGGLPAFIAAVLIGAITKGYYLAGSCSYILNLWDGNWLRDSVLQANYAVWSIGAAIGPFVMQPFLVELPSSHAISSSSPAPTSTSYGCSSDHNASTDSLTASSMCSTVVMSYGNTSTDNADTVDVSAVRLAFVVCGSTFVLPSLLFFVAGVRVLALKRRQLLVSEAKQNEKPPANNCTSQELNEVATSSATVDSLQSSEASNRTKSSSSDTTSEYVNTTASNNINPLDDAKQSRSRYRFLYVAFLGFLFLFYHIDMYVEQIIMSYLTAFAIKYAGWTVKAASDVMAVYFAGQFGGLILSIFISPFVPPQVILVFNISATAVACLLMLIVDLWSAILWVSSALAGFAISSTYGAGLLWFSNTTPVTGLVSAVMVIGSASGSMIGPLIVGQMFDTVTPMSFVYALIASIIAHAAVFVCMFAFNTRYSGELKNTKHETEEDKSVANCDEAITESSHSVNTVSSDLLTYF